MSLIDTPDSVIPVNIVLNMLSFVMDFVNIEPIDSKIVTKSGSLVVLGL